MSWIETIAPEKATGRLARIYERVENQRGKVANVLQVHSLNPDALKQHLALYQTLLFQHSPLSRADRELLAVVISSANNCAYCIIHHREALAHQTSEEFARQVAENPDEADLNDAQRAMIDYAVKLTQDVTSMKEEDVDELREAGFTDRTILDINLITSYFNFVNRIAEGLGVEYNQEEVRGYNY